MIELNLIDMLPPSTKRMKEEQEIQRVLSLELNEISRLQYQIQRNANITTCDEYGIAVKESDAGYSMPPTATLEQRISKALIVYNNHLPYNWANLIALLNNVIGADNYEIEEGDLELTIAFTGENVSQAGIINEVRERIPTKELLRVIYVRKYEARTNLYTGMTTAMSCHFTAVEPSVKI